MKIEKIKENDIPPKTQQRRKRCSAWKLMPYLYSVALKKNEILKVNLDPGESYSSVSSWIYTHALDYKCFVRKSIPYIVRKDSELTLEDF